MPPAHPTSTPFPAGQALAHPTMLEKKDVEKGAGPQSKMGQHRGLSFPWLFTVSEKSSFRKKKMERSWLTGLRDGPKPQKIGIKQNHMGILHTDGSMRRQELMGKLSASALLAHPALMESSFGGFSLLW